MPCQSAGARQIDFRSLGSLEHARKASHNRSRARWRGWDEMIISRHAEHKTTDYRFQREQSRYSERLQHSPTIWKNWDRHVAYAIAIILLGLLIIPCAEFISNLLVLP